MSKTVAIIALLVSVGWAVYAFRASHRSGDMDKRVFMIIGLCVLAVGVLGYLSIGSGYSPGTCGSGPTAYDC